MMRDQKTLKDALRNVLENEVWVGSQHMTDYCVKQANYIVPLNNDEFMVIDRPSIDTTFCFGYGQNGVSTNDEYKRAAGMENYARTNENYFLDENLRGISQTIEDLKNDENDVYKYLAYNGQKSESKLKSITVTKRWNGPEYQPEKWDYLKDLEKITDEERAEIIKGYELVRENFRKRLLTYLKKYGTTKLRTWTYLVD